MNQIERRTEGTRTATVTGNGPSSTVHMDGLAFGIMVVDAAMTSTIVKWLVSVDGVTFVTLQDGAGADIPTTIAAGKAVALPTDLAGCKAFQVVPQTSEGAQRTLSFCFKT